MARPELHLGILVIVPSPLDHDAHPLWHSPDALRMPCTAWEGSAELVQSCQCCLWQVLCCWLEEALHAAGRPTLLQTCLFSLTSILTSVVLMFFCANFLISFTARGALHEDTVSRGPSYPA